MWVWFSSCVDTFCSPSAMPWWFCVALSPSVHWHTRFYIAALSIIFFVGFLQWRSRADRVVNLNTTISLPLFWRTWTRALAQTRPHLWSWHMGRDYSYCRASELTDCQISVFCFSWFLEKKKKGRPHQRLFKGFRPRLPAAPTSRKIWDCCIKFNAFDNQTQQDVEEFLGEVLGALMPFFSPNVPDQLNT